MLVLATLGAGLMLAQLIERTTLVRDSDTTMQLLNSIVQVEGATEFFLHGDRQAASGNIEEFFVHLGNLPNVLRTNAYGFDREILWSSDRDLVGRRFRDNAELEAAFRGEPVINSGIVGAPSEKAEHEELGEVGAHYVENYLPIWGKQPGEPPVVGVIEIYRTPVGLFAAIQQSATRAWLGAGAVALAVYVILVGMVWRAQCLVRLQQGGIGGDGEARHRRRNGIRGRPWPAQPGSLDPLLGRARARDRAGGGYPCLARGDHGPSRSPGGLDPPISGLGAGRCVRRPRRPSRAR